jgi:hypothetical protein
VLRLCIILAPWTCCHFIVQMAFFIGTFRLALLNSLPTGLETSVLDQLRDELLADLGGGLVCQDRPRHIVLGLVADHVGIVTVLHRLEQFQVLHTVLQKLVVLLQFHLVIVE